MFVIITTMLLVAVAMQALITLLVMRWRRKWNELENQYRILRLDYEFLHMRLAIQGRVMETWLPSEGEETSTVH